MTIHDKIRKEYIEENKKLGIDEREFAFNLSLGYVSWLECKIEKLQAFNKLLNEKIKLENTFDEIERKAEIYT
jgi:hypothetical protein